MRAALAALGLVLLAAPARAHDGPPYALVVDEPFAGRTLTLYADPDVGVGTFYLYLEPAEPDGWVPVRFGAQPADGRLDEAFVDAERARADAPYQGIAEVPFDRRGPWRLRLVADAPAGPDAAPLELLLDVEVTPPGSLGPIDVVWFLAPFAAIGFLWIKALRQRRRAAEQDLLESETP